MPVRMNRRAKTLALCTLLLLLAASALLTLRHSPDGNKRPSGGLEDYEALLRTADQMRERVHVADWIVGARIKEMPGGVDSIFAFVRDSIRYEPYAGVLRGTDGTYMSRAGNAVDRALLLADMLERKGVHARFAIGTLNAPSKERLFQRTFEFPAQSAPTTLPTGGSRFHERLFRRATHDYDVVRRALGDRLPPDTKPSREDVESEMNPHVWVQAELGNAWVDLDPSFADSKPGMRNANVERTVPEIPSELFQTLTIRVRKENLSAGELVSSTLLEVQRKTVELADRQIVFTHTRPTAGGAMGGLAGAFGHTLGNASDTWEPTLWISGEFTNGTPVDVASPTFVAEWLDFELTWPGGRREVTSRVLVERGDAAWRSTRPLDPAMLHALAHDDDGSFDMRAAHNVWISTGRHNLVDFTDAARDLAAHALLREARDELPPDSAANAPADLLLNDGDFGVSVWPFVLQNFAWMLWTDHALIPLLNDDATIRLFADGPRIAIFSAGSTAGDSVVTISDLRRDDLRGVARDASHALALSERKLRYGLMEGALEQEALGEFVTVAGGDPAMVQTTSSSLSSDASVLVVRGTSASPMPDGLDPDATARLRATLAGGYTVVAPVGAGQRDGTWWEVADNTADTRAMGGLGLHVGKGPPMKFNKPIQINSHGGPKAYDPRPYEVRVKEARDLAMRSRRLAFEERAALQIKPNGLGAQQQPTASGSTGYTLLLVIGGIIKQMVIDAFAVWMLKNLYLSVEDFLANGFHSGGANLK